MQEATLEAAGPETTSIEETNSADDHVTRYQYPWEGWSSPSLSSALAGRTINAPAMSPATPSNARSHAGGFPGLSREKETAATRAAIADTTREKGFIGVIRTVFRIP